MNLNADIYQMLYDVQKLCYELYEKIDSVIRIMEILRIYMQYSNMMTDVQPDLFSKFMPERSEKMNPMDFQKMMNTAKQSDQQMSPEEFNKLFETLKQGKSPDEIARMEQMVQLAKSFLK